MAKFCIYCGKAIGENTKFCPFCGKAAAPQTVPAPETADTSPVESTPAQASSPQPQPAPQPAASAAPTAPATAPTAAPAAAPTTAPAAGNRINWPLIVSIIVIAAVLALIVVLVLQNKDTGSQTQNTPVPSTQEEWPDIPGFRQDDVASVAHTLMPECELLSYDHVNYNESEQVVYLYGCRLKAPEGSLLDLSDAAVDMLVDLGEHICSFSGFSGTLSLKTGDQFTVSDPGGNEIEVYFEAQPYITTGGYTVQFPNVFIADLTRMDTMGISDPTMSLDMTFNTAGDDSEFAYALLTDDGTYVIYLDELFRPAGYESAYYF